ncbi:MAG TPA: hypothetical protein VHI54_09480 [Actinomycetota bacterium]|nr:hypothetical protein [Actinomycetota bacterium]
MAVESRDPSFTASSPSSTESETSKTEQATTAAKEQAKEVAGTAAQAAQGVAAEAGQQARQVAQEASRQVRGIADQAKEQARQQANNQTQRAAQSLRTLSDQMRALAEGRQQESGDARNYASWFADRAADMAQQLESRGLEGLVSDLKSFARRRPALFLAGSAATGFLISRVAKSAQGSQQAEEQTFAPSALAGGELPAAATLQQDTARIGDISVEPLPAGDVDPAVVTTDVDPTVVEASESVRSGAAVADEGTEREGA